MSFPSKTGPSRIPTYGSRIPQTDLKPPVTDPRSVQVTPKNIGNRVCVGDKEGILRFVGEVQFSKGVWCGIELFESFGKNDGCVNGVRYFSCSDRHGLMAPLPKVSFAKSNCETLSDNASGPYSMLFVAHTKGEQDIDVNNEDIRNAKPVDNKKRYTKTESTSQQLENKEKKSDVDISAYSAIDKSSGNVLNDSSVEVKRRRTSNPKVKQFDGIVLRSLSENIEKPSSLPQLKCISNSHTALGKFASSTPGPCKRDLWFSNIRLSDVHQDTSDNENGKRDSLELDESLGLLTPDEMMTHFSDVQSLSPNFEFDYFPLAKKLESPRDNSLGLLDEKVMNLAVNKIKPSNLDVPQIKDGKEEVQSPNLTDYSLGIIDERMLSNITMRTDTTVNMELPLDVEKTDLNRMEQTPSPEELPLDPTPIVECDSKTEPTKSKTSNSIINSITSITSLDTGYQGDGEMSRPASRGADNSPLTRRPLARPQSRSIDPMTDSDFYTESDADNHEENPLRGDRRAQVIDGTLYGVDPQAAADIYVNNRENMDSSGIFTDIESSTRNDNELIITLIPDVSPSDTSSKTISENSQNNVQQIIEKSSQKKQEEKKPQKENTKKRNAPSPGISSPSFSSPRHGAKEDNSNSAKKYKMPKREVPSKIKSNLTPNNEQNSEKKLVKKAPGRWDAVMSKITKNEQNKTNLKEVKSKVFNSIEINSGVPQRKIATRNTVNQKNPNSKLIASSAAITDASPNIKKRRIRNRLNTSPPAKTIGNNLESSNHSSLSDFSAATLPPTTKKFGSVKKRTDVLQVTQVLTANKLTPRSQQTAAENKKNAALYAAAPTADPKARIRVFSPKEKKPTIKECTRGAVKGGRTSPVVRPLAPLRAPVKQPPPVAEALAVLVQHLVFNVNAFQVPSLKNQVEKFRLENEELKLLCKNLEEALAQAKAKEVQAIEKFRNEITEMNQHYAGKEQQYLSEKEAKQHNLCKQHEEQLANLKKEFEKLQKTHAESLDILREENEAIREQIDEKNAEIEKARHESWKLKEDYETKETILKEHNQKLKQQISKLEGNFEERLKSVVEQNKRLREENDRLLSYGDEKGISIQEVQSLRAVLELKQNEVSELRKSLAEVTQKADILVLAEEKSRVLNARCEDLELQLQRKIDVEKNLAQENFKLQESFKEEINQKQRLSQYNEELQWKLKQNKEVINKVLEHAEETAFNRKLISSSFNERHNATRLSMERALSFRERSYSNRSTNGEEKGRKSISNDDSPPTSPKVKVIMEKSDSVSYVLEMDESPDVVASRIVRRSFRNATPVKSTPTKSPSNKRPRIRNPLSQSSSSNAIVNGPKNEIDRPRSVNSRNGDSDNDSVFMWSPNAKCEDFHDESCDSPKLDNHDDLDIDEDNVEDLRLLTLPSELERRNGAQALPCPKHLAGEAMISESNSEDESTSSSQL